MEKQSFAIFILMVSLSVVSIPANSQIQYPYYQFDHTGKMEMRLNPWQGLKTNESPWKGYTMEYLGFELGYLGGAAVTTGLFLGGFIAAWGGNQEIAIPLLIGSGVTAIATPFLSAYLMKRFGQKYRPGGKYGIAVLGSFAGMGIVGGASVLAQYLVANNYSYENEVPVLMRVADVINNAGLLLVPGMIAVLIYNLYPKSVAISSNNSLFNYTNGKLEIGNPQVFLSPGPMIPGRNFTQVKLLNVSF